MKHCGNADEVEAATLWGALTCQRFVQSRYETEAATGRRPRS